VRIALSNPDVGLSGGVERVITEAANRLSRRGNAVTVYAAETEPGVLDPEVQVRRVPVPGRVDLRTGVGFRSRCAAAIGSDRPDVHGAFSALSPVSGVFWVPSVHRIGYELLRSRRGAAGRLWLAVNPYHRVRLSLERTMLEPGADVRVLAQTEQVRAEIARCYGRAARDVGVLPLGYDAIAFAPGARAERRDQARARFGYTDCDRVLLFLANELERKGFDVLARAAACVPEAKVLGAGRVAPSARMIDRLGIRDQLQWAGHVTDVPLLHAAADALVLPTRYEPWGLVIVEALGSGLPVVTTRLAGAAVAVRDRLTGWLLDDPEDVPGLADAIRWAVSDTTAPAPQIAESVREYEWDRVIGSYERALQEAAAAS
jgi:UDP-glucose:(heptosyl)LPS alpha-1,3-glucosyltransferase